MKVIDMLNKIANGEEVRFKILNNDEIYHCYRYDTLFNETVREEVKWYIDEEWLKAEIEIIEKKIPEKLLIGLKTTKENEIHNTLIIGDSQYELNEKEEMICKKIHEIIDYLNSKGDE